MTLISRSTFRSMSLARAASQVVAPLIVGLDTRLADSGVAMLQHDAGLPVDSGLSGDPMSELDSSDVLDLSDPQQFGQALSQCDHSAELTPLKAIDIGQVYQVKSKNNPGVYRIRNIKRDTKGSANAVQFQKLNKAGMPIKGKTFTTDLPLDEMFYIRID